MTSEKRQKNDMKLLLWVSGLVVAGAACIALLAGLSAERNAEREARAERETFEQRVAETRRTVPRRAPVAPAEPAVFETEPATLPSDEPVVDSRPVYEITPGENLLARGLETYESRDFERSAFYLAAEIEARPERPWTHYMLGLALWKAGRHDEAVASMEQSAALDATSIKTFVNLSRIHNDAGDFEAALQAAQTALEIDGEDPTARFLEGRSLFNQGRLAEARIALEQSLAVDPDNGYVQNLLGLAQIQSGEAAAAVRSLARAAELQPDVDFIQNNLGMAHELNGQATEAVAAYRRATEIDPGHERAAVNLARVEPLVPTIDPIAVASEAVPAAEPVLPVELPVEPTTALETIAPAAPPADASIIEEAVVETAASVVDPSVAEVSDAGSSN